MIVLLARSRKRKLVFVGDGIVQLDAGRGTKQSNILNRCAIHSVRTHCQIPQWHFLLQEFFRVALISILPFGYSSAMGYHPLVRSFALFHSLAWIKKLSK